MRDTLRRLPLEHFVSIGIAITVVDIAAGSNWSPTVRSVAGPLRWVLLAGLCAVSLAYAAGRHRVEVPRTSVYVLGAVFLAFAAASAGWSVAPRTTLARIVAFGTVLVVAGALAVATARRREGVVRTVEAVLAGAVAVAVIGLAILAVAPGKAVQHATSSTPTRFRGLGQNPNTVVMLFAVAMPIAASLAVARRGRRRYLAVAALMLLAGSIVASGSRAALAAGFVASLAPVLAACQTRRAAAVATAGCALCLAAGIAISKIPSPNPNDRRSASSYAIPCTKRDAQCFLRLEDEKGRPPAGRADEPKGRQLLGSSGRTDAWRGALGQAADRPLVGYGFGTEGRVFVDRYYWFEGGLPENSYIGVLLQLGAVGAAVFLGLLASLMVVGTRTARRASGDDLVLVATCGAVLLVGLGLALFQSYLYAAGNNATLSVWICAFLLTALAAGRAERA